jgi:SAM-dependent methyltransferase
MIAHLAFTVDSRGRRAWSAAADPVTLVSDAIAQYPASIGSYYAGDLDRLAHDVGLVTPLEPGHLVDLGSGFSPFSLALRRAGWDATVVDLFDYAVDAARAVPGAAILSQFAEAGIAVERCDIQGAPLPFATASVGVATCFAVLEHFHRSPRAFLAEVFRVVRPGGWLITSCPNSVNLRKRVSVLTGRTNLPPVHAFWRDGDPVWHGHVREPTMSELAWMVRESGFTVARTFGRNFLARQNFGAVGRLLDPVLRAVPGLCSDIYVIARRP